MEINEDVVKKLLGILDKGLPRGMGVPRPGEMCVQAAVTFATGEEFSDHPTCVNEDIRSLMIGLNDSHWGSNQARAQALRHLAIAQLGSNRLPTFVVRNELQMAGLLASHGGASQEFIYGITKGNPHALADKLMRVLRKVKSPGLKYLHLADPPEVEEPKVIAPKQNVFLPKPDKLPVKV